MNQSIDGAMENPSSATAVRKQLNNVILPVPRRSTILLLNRLDTMVPPAMIMDTIPAEPRDEPISGQITGHAEPSKESGSPRLIKARYIIIKNQVDKHASPS